VHKTIRTTLVALMLTASMQGAFATTKGLNQIVTPDIQPEGILSISIQQADPNVTNRYQTQYELGITKRFEVAVFQGFSPPVQVLNVEYGLIQQKNLLMSTGFAGYASNGTPPQPYLEMGWQQGNVYAMAGAIYVTTPGQGLGPSAYQTDSILGIAYHVSPRLLVQTDYQSGDSNFGTAGFTYNITPALSFNPAAYYSNSSPHKTYGYAVLTWNVTAWK
jgi:hypothetical protein